MEIMVFPAFSRIFLVYALRDDLELVPCGVKQLVFCVSGIHLDFIGLGEAEEASYLRGLIFCISRQMKWFLWFILSSLSKIALAEFLISTCVLCENLLLSFTGFSFGNLIFFAIILLGSKLQIFQGSSGPA